MTTAADLYALQDIDIALDSAVENLKEIESQLGEMGQLIEARQRVEECRELVRRLQHSQKELDSEADELREKVAGIESKLYGGSVTNPKELEDFEADLGSVRSQLSKREDVLLEAMVELEQAEADLRESEGVLTRVEESWKGEQAELEDTAAKLKEEIQELEARRDGEVDGMDRGALSLYEAVRKRRRGTAVAVVQRGLCQGCRISLPMSILQKARAGAGLVQCVSCERILMVS